MRLSLAICTVVALACVASANAEVPESVLTQAGDNRAEIEKALTQAPADQREGMEFLVLNMPQRDLQSLTAEYLLKNSRLAHAAWKQSKWSQSVPKEVFFNNVLPYVSINERRDDWREDFRKRFQPLVKEAKSASEAATILNRQIFKQLNVKYSTKRKRADQSPYESIEGGTASCTGLSVLLIDACRSVGVPARMVGTPLWANKSGNHSWVEVWDDGWQFTGAAEPTGDQLNRGWFVGRAATAIRDQPVHAIYATSFKRTPLYFPCVWNPSIKYVPAVNVTDRYTALKKELPEGHVQSMFVVRDENGQRVAVPFWITKDGKPVYQGVTNDEGFDANDHICVPLKKGQQFILEMKFGDNKIRREIKANKTDELFTVKVKKSEENASRDESSKTPTSKKKSVSSDESQAALSALKKYLALDPSKRGAVADQAFVNTPLSQADAEAARDALANDRLAAVRKERADEMKAKVIKDGDLKMPFFYKKFGEKPKDGWSLYISLHGGGGAPARVNDQQWENQKRLYKLKEGVYVAPRAPTNTWNLWHQGHIDRMFDQLIENLVAFEEVNWDRVYVMGYSAGGDGVFQLAPRMADRWAAAAMMAGHPNETSPLGLRNVPFALQMGGKDGAYSRNKKAAEWKASLAKLQKQDPQGYDHFVKIYPNKGHWMDREDAIAIPWMAKKTRNATPQKIVWKQDDVTHPQFYWLSVDEKNRKARSEVVASVDGQTVTVKGNVQQLGVLLDDRFIDLDKPVKIESDGKVLFEGTASRTIAALANSLERRGDPRLTFPCEVKVDLPKPFPHSFVAPDEIPRYAASRSSAPLKIDGRLDEPAWKSAKKTNAFVDLLTGKPTAHDTRAAITWDDQYLYIGFWLAEPNVQAKYKNRDDPLYYDNDAEVFIAGANAYYEFEINAYGTVYEGFFVWKESYEKDGYAEDPQLKPGAKKSQPFNGVGFKHHPRGGRIAFLGYDFPNFKSAVHIDGTLNDDSDEDRGWTIELAFPWKEMKWLAKGDGRSLPPKSGDQWRIDLFRFNKDKAPGPPKDSGGWAWGKHNVWDSHIPEIFPIVTFND